LCFRQLTADINTHADLVGALAVYQLEADTDSRDIGILPEAGGVPLLDHTNPILLAPHRVHSRQPPLRDDTRADTAC